MKWVDIVTRKQNILLIYTKLYGWCEKLKGVLGVGFNHMLMVSHQEATTYYVRRSELTKLLKILKSKIFKGKPGPQSLAQIGIKHFQDVIDYLRSIAQKNLRGDTNRQLALYFENYFTKQIQSLPFLVLPTFVDEIFVDEMQRYLEKFLKIYSSEKTKQILEYINIFASLDEESYATKAERELLEIASQLLKENKIAVSANIKQFTASMKRDPVIYNKVLRYNQKWEWLPIQAEEEPYNVDFLISELQKLVMSPAKIKIRLSALDKHTGTIKAKKTQLLKDLNIDQSHRRLIAVFQEWVYLKDFRRSSISQERLYSRPLYAEIGRRLDLTGREVRFLSPNELVGTLSQKSNLPSKEEIHSRMKAFVLLRHNKKIQLLTGEKVNKIIRQELPVSKVSGEKILKGSPATRGKAKGKVKIIFGVQDASKITVGDVLVARQTTPDLLGAMKKSIAVITDEGGLLCHAAIVSRELKIPCIVGVKIATNVLKDGDIVEVNADNGMVKILKKYI